ncbi:hypothetical protein THAOC_19552, partial [Thalassiosira oceanica]
MTTLTVTISLWSKNEDEDVTDSTKDDTDSSTKDATNSTKDATKDATDSTAQCPLVLNPKQPRTATHASAGTAQVNCNGNGDIA